MPDTKYTPKPWTLFRESYGPGKWTIAVLKGKKQVVCWTGFDASDFQKEALANARLISAAPDLAEALQRIVKVLHTVTEDDDGVTYFNGRYCGELQAPLAEAKAILRKAGLL